MTEIEIERYLRTWTKEIFKTNEMNENSKIFKRILRSHFMKKFKPVLNQRL